MNLIFADLCQAASFLISFYWIAIDGILAPTAACTIQGFLLHFGDVASAFFVLAIALLLVLPLILGNMPWTWAVEIAERLPGTSAIVLIFGGGPSDSLSDGQARITLLVWAAGLLAVGGWRLVRSDANR